MVYGIRLTKLKKFLKSVDFFTHPPVLLGCIEEIYVLNYFLFFQIGLKFNIMIFSTISTTKNLNPFVVLSFHLFMKLLEYQAHFTFGFHQVKPCHLGIMVKKTLQTNVTPPNIVILDGP